MEEYNPLQVLNLWRDRIALVEKGKSYTYADLLNRISYFRNHISSVYQQPVPVVLQADFSFNAISCLFALLAENFVVYLHALHQPITQDLKSMVGFQGLIIPDENRFELWEVTPMSKAVSELIANKQAGIIFLSSGSSGKPKMVLHAAARLLNKFTQSKKAYKTLGFLLFDHIAGFDTMMYTLYAGGCLVILQNRSIDHVLQTLQETNIEVFPASPSYLNLLLLDDRFSSENLPELKIITFGSERINEATLSRMQSRFAGKVRCEQKYGLTELGSLIIRTKPDDPRWIQFDSRFADWRIIDSCLHVKTNTSLLAYLFADHEEPCSGWFNTGDRVEQDGDWIKILGRESDLMNIGGQKVYPAEVESVLQQMENVVHVSVNGKAHPLMGEVVSAVIQIKAPESEADFRKRMRLFCKGKLEAYKVPVWVTLQLEHLLTDRFKTQRSS